MQEILAITPEQKEQFLKNLESQEIIDCAEGSVARADNAKQYLEMLFDALTDLLSLSMQQGATDVEPVSASTFAEPAPVSAGNDSINESLENEENDRQIATTMASSHVTADL